MANSHSPVSIFFLPHQDDEYFVSGFLHRFRDQCLCFYLTDGEARGISQLVRNRESTKALEKLGLSREAFRFLPQGHSVPDLQLMNCLEDLIHWIQKETQDLNVDRIFCPAWEGGHPDHDAAYLLGKAFGKKRNLPVFEFAMYNGFQLPYPLFRAMVFPQKREILDFPLKWKEKIFYAFLFLNYPSQWRTWIGLAPLTLWQFWMGKGFSVSRTNERLDLKMEVSEMPFYEKRKQSTRQIFFESTKAFRKKYLD